MSKFFINKICFYPISSFSFTALNLADLDGGFVSTSSDVGKIGFLLIILKEVS